MWANRLPALTPDGGSLTMSRKHGGATILGLQDIEAHLEAGYHHWAHLAHESPAPCARRYTQSRRPISIVETTR